MKNKTIDSDHIFRNTQMQLTPAIMRAAKLHSKKIPGCSRPNEGSINHFVVYSVLQMLKACGCDLKKAHPEVYDK